MNYKVVILPILICLLSSRCFQHRTNKASSEASPAEPVNETETPITSKEYHVRYDKLDIYLNDQPIQTVLMVYQFDTEKFSYYKNNDRRGKPPVG